MKAKKVYTPGSKPSRRGQPSNKGRPRNLNNIKIGTSRKDNYRTKYNQETLQEALNAVSSNQMSVREAERHFKVRIQYIVLYI